MRHESPLMVNVIRHRSDRHGTQGRARSHTPASSRMDGCLTDLPARGRLARVAALRPMFLLVTVFVLTGFGGGSSPLRPGNELSGMMLIKGTAARADLKLFDVCDPVILTSGRYTRKCRAVPRVSRLFIGYGQFDRPRVIDKTWRSPTWAAWLDGRRIDLPRFGTSDRTLVAFHAAGGKSVTLREWRVMLVEASPGRHTLRYRFRDASGVVDATWVFAVRGQ